MTTQTATVLKSIAEQETALVEKKRWPDPTSPTRPNNWMSGIGHPCLRYLYYERTAQNKKLPFPHDALRAMKAGEQHEEQAKDDLRKMGYIVIDTDRQFFIEELQLSGRIDCYLYEKGESDSPNKAILVDVKSFERHSFKNFNTVEDFLNAPWYWKKYVDQLHGYMRADERDTSGIVMRCRPDTAMKGVVIPFDKKYWAAIENKLNDVNEAVVTGSPPERCTDLDVCSGCAFRIHCLPPAFKKKDGILIDNDPIAIQMLTRLDELKPLVKEYNKLDKARKERYDKIAAASVGPFVITGQRQDRSGYAVKPFSFWESKFMKL